MIRTEAPFQNAHGGVWRCYKMKRLVPSTLAAESGRRHKVSCSVLVLARSCLKWCQDDVPLLWQSVLNSLDSGTTPSSAVVRTDVSQHGGEALSVLLCLPCHYGSVPSFKEHQVAQNPYKSGRSARMFGDRPKRSSGSLFQESGQGFRLPEKVRPTFRALLDECCLYFPFYPKSSRVVAQWMTSCEHHSPRPADIAPQSTLAFPIPLGHMLVDTEFLMRCWNSATSANVSPSGATVALRRLIRAKAFVKKYWCLV